MDFLGDIVAILAILGAAGSLVSMIVSIFKIVGLIKDGDSGKVAKILDLLLFVAVAVIYFLKITVDWGTINAYFVLANGSYSYDVTITGATSYTKLRFSEPCGGQCVLKIDDVSVKEILY